MIYREAICDICETEDDVVEEVTITVVHEIAHHFGIDDDRLHELGWALGPTLAASAGYVRRVALVDVPENIASAGGKGGGLPIKMLHDRILVALRKEDGDRRSSGGILIPATAQVAKRLVWGEARGVGASVPSGEGRRPGALLPRGPARGRGARRGPDHPARARRARRRRRAHRGIDRPLPLSPARQWSLPVARGSTQVMSAGTAADDGELVVGVAPRSSAMQVVRGGRRRARHRRLIAVRHLQADPPPVDGDRSAPRT